MRAAICLVAAFCAAGVAARIIGVMGVFAGFGIKIKLHLEFHRLFLVFFDIFNDLLLNRSNCRIIIHRLIFRIGNISARFESPGRIDMMKVIASHFASSGVAPQTRRLPALKLRISFGNQTLGFCFFALFFIYGFED